MARSMKSVVCCVVLSATVLVLSADDFTGSAPVIYDRHTFRASVSEGIHFVMFYKNKCKECEKLASVWIQLAELYNTRTSIVTIAKVNCGADMNFCVAMDVDEFPSVILYTRKTDDTAVFYSGKHELLPLHKFVEERVLDVLLEDNAIPPKQKTKAAVDLKADRFEDFISQGFHFVRFYTSWCAHCKLMENDWQQLAHDSGGSTEIFISQVDCTRSKSLCAAQEIPWYPSLILFQNGEKIETYQGGRKAKDLKSFIDRKMWEHHRSVFAVGEQGKVAELTDSNFETVIADGLIFVKFFTPGCNRSAELAPVWAQLAEASASKDILIASVDCSQNLYVCEGHFVTSYPFLSLFQNGIHLTDYSGELTLDDLQNYVNTFLFHDEL